MKKVLVSVILIFTLALSFNVFAHHWEEIGGNWYVVDDASKVPLKNMLLDTGDNVYYLDVEGKLVTGWWKDKDTGKYYFFDNKDDRNLGGMVFGLHMIDGYYHYFGDNGALITSNHEDTVIKYNDYYIDFNGYVYKDNKIMRDVSIERSEFYTNPAYYKSMVLNNYYLAYNDASFKEYIPKDTARVENYNTNDYSNKEGKKSADLHRTTGGLNYVVDDEGRVTTYGDTFETKPAEKYGPMNVAE